MGTESRVTLEPRRSLVRFVDQDSLFGAYLDRGTKFTGYVLMTSQGGERLASVSLLQDTHFLIGIGSHPKPNGCPQPAVLDKKPTHEDTTTGSGVSLPFLCADDYNVLF